MSEDDRAFEAMLAHAGGPMQGWDFSYLSRTERMASEPLPWSYGSLVIAAMADAGSMLDMGTGGGEFLSALRPLPLDTHATEGWAPNIPIARKRLEPLGIAVYGFASEDDPLPFPDQTFDLVINRHEAYDPAEVLRVLRPGGRFITQQVGGESERDLNRLLDTPPEIDYSDWTLPRAREELTSAGFTLLDAREAFPINRCYDIGALIFYLNATPWHVAGFSVEAFRPKLRELHDRIMREGFIDLRSHRFLLVAEAPGHS
jgi:SAM-dependent methyltransferase